MLPDFFIKHSLRKFLSYYLVTTVFEYINVFSIQNILMLIFLSLHSIKEQKKDGLGISFSAAAAFIVRLNLVAGP